MISPIFSRELQIMNFSKWCESYRVKINGYRRSIASKSPRGDFFAKFCLAGCLYLGNPIVISQETLGKEEKITCKNGSVSHFRVKTITTGIIRCEKLK